MRDSVRWGLIGGLLFLAFGLAATIISLIDSPDFDAGGGRIQEYFEDRTAAIVISSILYGLASFAFAFFLGTFRAVLKSAEGGAGILSSISMGAGFAGVALLSASTGATWAAVMRADDNELSKDSAQTLFDLGGALYVFAHPLIGAFMVASGAVIIQTGMLPKWLGWIGVGTGILLVCPFISWAVFALVPIWVAAVSVILLDRGERLSVDRGGV